MTGNVPATVTVDKQNQEGVETLGWDIVYQTQYNPPGEASWTPFAQAMQSNGVKGLVYIGEPENAANLLKAFDDIEYELDWVSSAPTTSTTSSSRSAARGSTRTCSPRSCRRSSPRRTRPPSSTSTCSSSTCRTASRGHLGSKAFSAWLLFARPPKECGADLTRECVYEAAKHHRVDRWRPARRAEPSTHSQGPRCGW